MKTIFSLVIYFFVVIATMQNWLLLALLGVLLFSVRQSAAWLIPAAIVLDGYFGAFYHVPYLSLLALSWYAFFQTVRPHLNNLRV